MSCKIEQAVEGFHNGLNCAQAVLNCFCEQFGLDCGLAVKIATGFGGGMRMAETCGAVTGALMVLGLKYGNATAEQTQAKAKTYELIIEFIHRFKARNGSVVCRQLLDCDISTAEGRATAESKDLFSAVCPQMVRDAADILEEMLAEHG